MVRHNMQAHKAHLESERLRLALGMLTPAERAAREQAEAERVARDAKEKAKGVPLFGDEK